MKRPRRPMPEDEHLWHHVAREVKPLRRRGDWRRRTEDAAAPEQTPTKPARKTAARAARMSAPPMPTPQALPLAAGLAPGLDRRTAMRLRRGRLDIEARIDLHGRTREAARAALAGFLARGRDRGLRCVLVITGKGLRGEGSGVIRAELPHWLNDASLRPWIVAFTEAQPKDGGAGAFYVYLRRRRDQ